MSDGGSQYQYPGARVYFRSRRWVPGDTQYQACCVLEYQRRTQREAFGGWWVVFAWIGTYWFYRRGAARVDESRAASEAEIRRAFWLAYTVDLAGG